MKSVERAVLTKDFEEKYLLSTETVESAVGVIIAELVGAISGFDNWYWDEDDYRQEWLPDVGEDLGDLNEGFELYKEISEVFGRNKKEAEEFGEPFPSGVVESVVVGRLSWMVENWSNWYYEYKVVSDQAEWSERAGLNDDAYIYDEYGDVDKSPGISNIYDEENKPFVEVESELELDQVAVVSASGFITLHLQGQHDQSSHGKGGGSKGGTTTPSSAPVPASSQTTAKPPTEPAPTQIPKEEFDRRSKELKQKLKNSTKNESFASELTYKIGKKAIQSKMVRKWAIKAAITAALPIGLNYAGSKALKSVGLNMLAKEEQSLMAKTVFKSVIGHDGQELKLYDTTGKMSDGEMDTYLGHLKDAHKLHPLGKKPPMILIHDESTRVPGAMAFVSPKKGSRVININRDVLKPHADETRILSKLGGSEWDNDWFGKTYSQNPERHIVLHEYGHLADYSSRSPGSTLKSKINFKRSKGLGLSSYGKTDHGEAYAEAFADHYGSGSKSTSVATNNYAKSYNWN